MIFPRRFRDATILSTLQSHEWRVVPADAPITHVLDVGANVGLFSLYARMRWPFAKILAVEPDDSVFAMLCENVARLSIETLRAACGPAGQAALLKPDGRYFERHFAPTECGDVFSVPLDALVARLVADASPQGLLIKVDIEGAENYWLDDAETAEALRSADAVAIEVHPPRQPIAEWLVDVFYRTHDLRTVSAFSRNYAIHAVRKGFGQ